MTHKYFRRGLIRSIPFVLTIVGAAVFGLTQAMSEDKLTITPSPLTFADDKPQKLSIKNPGGTTLEGSSKFRVVSTGFNNNANNLIKFDPDTLTITPLTSGQMTLTIEYKESDNAAAVTGEVKIVIPYKTVYLTEPFKKTPQGNNTFKNDSVTLVSGQKYDVKAEGIDITGKTVPVTADVTVSNNFVTLDANRTPTALKAQSIATSADSTLTVKADDVVFQEIAVKVIESSVRIEVVISGTPQSGTASVSIPEGETLKLDAWAIGEKGTKLPIQNDWIVQSGSLVTATIADNKLVLAAKDLPNDNPVTETITLRNNFGLSSTGQPTQVTTTLTVTVTPKGYYVELQAIPGNILLSTARISITGTLKRTRTNGSVEGQPIAFDLEDRDKSKVWMNLTQVGNTATVTWHEPTEAEIRAQYSGQLERRPSEVVVVATARKDNKDFTSKISIRMGNVEKFVPLKVKLNLMDDRTVSDLYGTVTSKDYYVLTVRLFNNLKDETTREYIGSSILAYSSSIEVAVNLEKRFNSNSDSYFPNVIKGGDAKKIAQKRSQAVAKIAEADASLLETTADEIKTTLKEALDKQYAALKDAIEKHADALVKRDRALQSRDPQDLKNANEAIVAFKDARRVSRETEDATRKIRAQIARAAANRVAIPQEAPLGSDTAIDDGLWHPVTMTDLERIAPEPAPTPQGTVFDDIPLLTAAEQRAQTIDNTLTPAAEQIPEPEPPCVGVIKYRPLTFEMVVNTVDRRDGRSKRTRIFTLLDLIGTGTSYVTSVAVPGSSSDLPLGLEKYRNLLIPGLDKLFPSLKEQQRQNIVSQSMKEIEEIPFGSDITRVLFIPRKTIRGWIRGHDVRISELCPFYFSVEVAIIQKGRTVEQGTIAR